MPDKHGSFIVVERGHDSISRSKKASKAVLKPVSTNQIPVDISSHCDDCQEMLEGPCFEHTDVEHIIYDKPPVPLAYSSIPDALQFRSHESITIRGSNKGDVIISKELIRAGTLFGPLIAPLVPVDEVQPGALRYILWSEDTKDIQVKTCGGPRGYSYTFGAFLSQFESTGKLEAEHEAYDLRDDFLCNWIKFIRFTSSTKVANVIAYQQHDSIYFVAVRDIAPSTELRVYVNRPQGCAELCKELFRFSEPPSTIYVKPDNITKPKRPQKRSKRCTEETEVDTGMTIVDDVRHAEITAEPSEPSEDDSEDDAEGTSSSDTSEKIPKPRRVNPQRGKYTRKELRDWRDLRSRYNLGDMTDEERQLFENHEITLDQKRQNDARSSTLKAYRAQKFGPKTWNSLSDTKYELLRSKLVQGIPLTPDEESSREKWLEYRRREYFRSAARKRTTKAAKLMTETGEREGEVPNAANQVTPVQAQETDLSPRRPKIHIRKRIRLKLKQGIPLTSAEQRSHETVIAYMRKFRERRKAEDEAAGIKRLNTTQQARLKHKQGLPMTPEEQLLYEKSVVRSRAESRKRNLLKRLAKGGGLEPMRCHKPGGAPYARKQPFAWQLTDQEKKNAGNNAKSSREESNKDSSEEETEESETEADALGEML